jgi:hypothetical protein
VTAVLDRHVEDGLSRHLGRTNIARAGVTDPGAELDTRMVEVSVRLAARIHRHVVANTLTRRRRPNRLHAGGR